MFRLKPRNPAFGLLLALILALSSGAMSVAAGKMRDARGRVVLCTGHGPLTLRTDGRGHPLHPEAPCPDGIPLMAALMPDLPAGPPLALVLLPGAVRPASLRLRGIAGPAPRARDPPFLL